jgi:plasmid replication initiation protein
MTYQDKLVIKSNSLIDLQTDLKLTQLKIFTKIIMHTVQEPQKEFCRFSIQELMQEFHMTGSNYTALKSATAGMIRAVILKNKDGEVQLPLFTKVSYKEGIVDMYLHPELKPYILDIKQRYTKYFFKSITGLNSIYSMRLYELLKQYEFRNSRSFKLEDLRFLLNISTGKYAKYTDFRKRVILSSQKELEEKTDISFEFTEIRERRKVVRLDFKIISQYQNTQEQKETVSNSSENSLESTLKTKLLLNTKQIETVLKQFDTAHIERNIAYTLKQKNIKNITGYFMKALELDY